MIPRGSRGKYLYAEAKKIALEGVDIADRCQKLALEALRSGMPNNQVYRHISRAVQKALAKTKRQCKMQRAGNNATRTHYWNR